MEFDGYRERVKILLQNFTTYTLRGQRCHFDAFEKSCFRLVKTLCWTIYLNMYFICDGRVMRMDTI